MAVLLNYPLFKVTDGNGLPVSGAKIYTYRAGTSTPQAAYSDQTGVTPLANPVIADARGEAVLWLLGLPYKVNVTDSLGVQIPNFPIDNLLAGPAWPTVSVAALSSSNGAAILTAAALIPAGQPTLVVTTKITTGFGTSQGLTSFAVGDGVVLDRWGVQTVLTTNALSGGSDAPAANQAHDASLPRYAAAQAVILTALGGLFDGTGAIEISAQTIPLTHRSA